MRKLDKEYFQKGKVYFDRFYVLRSEEIFGPGTCGYTIKDLNNQNMIDTGELLSLHEGIMRLIEEDLRKKYNG